MKLLFVLFCTCGILAGQCPTIELLDQYGTPHKLSFPLPRITVLTLADRKGSDEVDGWIVALKARYGTRVEYRGIAQVSGVPSLLRSHVGKKFQRKFRYPVMMDWAGQVCSQLGCEPEVANVLILARDGEILARARGKASAEAMSEISRAIDKSL